MVHSCCPGIDVSLHMTNFVVDVDQSNWMSYEISEEDLSTVAAEQVSLCHFLHVLVPSVFVEGRVTPVIEVMVMTLEVIERVSAPYWTCLTVAVDMDDCPYSMDRVTVMASYVVVQVSASVVLVVGCRQASRMDHASHRWDFEGDLLVNLIVRDPSTQRLQVNLEEEVVDSMAAVDNYDCPLESVQVKVMASYAAAAVVVAAA